MRTLRNIGFFFLGLAFVAIPMFAFAESMPLTNDVRPGVSEYKKDYGTIWAASAPAACGLETVPNQTCGFHSWITPDVVFKCACTGGAGGSSWPQGGRRVTCDAGYVLSGTTCTKTNFCDGTKGWHQVGDHCERPDCAPGEERGSNGLCTPPSCPVTESEGYYTGPVGGDITGQYCTAGCSVTISLPIPYSGHPTYASSTTRWVWAKRSTDGTACTTGSVPAAASPVPPPGTDPATVPPCPLGDGVVTAGGKVVCVPPTTPGATVPPVVTKSTSNKSYPDGSTTTNTTTNTCTGEGACSSTTNTVTTGATSGPNAGGAGQAGAVGTTEGKSDKPGDQPSDFCAQNPSLQICKGGISEETTQKDVLKEVKKLTSIDTTDGSSISSRNFDEVASEEGGIWATDAKIADFAHGIKSDAALNDKKTVWEATMSSGWFEPIPITGCAPFQFGIGSHLTEIDHCPIVEKVSGVASWVLWMWTAIGVFVALTGGSSQNSEG